MEARENAMDAQGIFLLHQNVLLIIYSVTPFTAFYLSKRSSDHTVDCLLTVTFIRRTHLQKGQLQLVPALV